jgi:hypothetical protein
MDDRVQLVFSVDNMNASVSGRESLNGAVEPGRDLLEIDVFDGTKSVRAKNRCNASRLETAAAVRGSNPADRHPNIARYDL